MKYIKRFRIFFIIIITATFVFCPLSSNYKVFGEEKAKNDFIKWVDFDVPYKALNKAMNIDINSFGKEKHLDWIQILSCLATKYGNNWKCYNPKDMDIIVEDMNGEDKILNSYKNNKNYKYYYKAYSAILCGFLDEFQKEIPYDYGLKNTHLQQMYGLKTYCPIASGFAYSHYDDFGNKRSYGFNRTHRGHDMMGSIGTPIVAVESGIAECVGWNQYGGWRVGIRSFDGKRYYYYAHMRKGHPYSNDLSVGDKVKAGDVIGYLGMTGYSAKEDINNMTTPHLHFGMQLIFDQSQEDGNGEIWVDTYEIVKLLSQNKSVTKYDKNTDEYIRLYEMFDRNFANTLD